MLTTVHVVIVLLLPRKVLDLIAYSRAVVTGITANPALLGKAPAIVAQTATATDELEAAQHACRKRTVGTIEIRNQKRAALVALLRQVGRFVQGVADAQPERAEEIARLAGLSVRKRIVRQPQLLSIQSDKHAGGVSLTAPRSRTRVIHEWHMSADGKAWLPASSTHKSRTNVLGLQQGVNTLFRHRMVTKEGPQEWSQMLAIFVQ